MAKNFTEEIFKAMQDEAMKLINSTITSSRVFNTPWKSLQTQDEWVQDLINGIIEGSNAVNSALHTGAIHKDQIKVSLTHELSLAKDGGTGARLLIEFDKDETARNLRASFYGGEIITKSESGETKTYKVDGQPGFREETLRAANEEFLNALQVRLENKNPRVIELINKFNAENKE